MSAEPETPLNSRQPGSDDGGARAAVERDTLAGQFPDKSRDREEAFHDAMWPEGWQTDHLGTVLRGVAYLDALLLSILERRLAKSRVLNLDRRGFLEKAKLARAIGAVDDDLLASLKIVADIRNEFAHKIGRRLEHKDVTRLCDSLKGRALGLFVCYTGGASKSPQRLRHALTVMKLALEEIADPARPKEYEWFDAERSERLVKQIQATRARDDAERGNAS
jgi:hypothetical protein